MKRIKILTVCLGNICRSPAAQGILESCADEYGVDLEVDSAGTAAYHVGECPDSRSIEALGDIGITIANQKARRVVLEDFDYFDWILAMDKDNLNYLRQIQPDNSHAKLVMFGEFAEGVSLGEVADPYYGKEDGFVKMREHLQLMSQSFIEHLTAHS
ncbi:Low molecular weight protein-tyrosine-phosphatase YfkJ [Marinomonas spartinae]|uniref:protein-tyrosine-phosphatase n=1 Tax=Marinomonas spartinae TaxID=1792290 RepID=A0A1A8TMC1_9GAMM|nr:low molecular weight protein-tyrosine-phosphatase [Marinomonas spartinae]SBS34237.1 Low molecular weight protein-tyrosine-phosphatase YfkJ [Marinomonas spartinae]